MYDARITRLNPTAFVILIDQSGSMQERTLFDSISMTKAEAVALAANIMIGEIVNRCRREDGVRDYFDIAVLGYGGGGVRSLLHDTQPFITPSVIARAEPNIRTFIRERTLPTGESVITSLKQKFWIEPSAGGSTPMYEALDKARWIVSRWCSSQKHSSCYPPTIFNITDGEASDGDERLLLGIAGEIKSLGTKNGNALLINIHISSRPGSGTVLFPSSADIFGEERYARLLYEISSDMPAGYNENISAVKQGHEIPPYRGMGYNTPVTDLIAMMNIGSVSLNMMQ